MRIQNAIFNRAFENSPFNRAFSVKFNRFRYFFLNDTVSRLFNIYK